MQHTVDDKVRELRVQSDVEELSGLFEVFMRERKVAEVEEAVVIAFAGREGENIGALVYISEESVEALKSLPPGKKHGKGRIAAQALGLKRGPRSLPDRFAQGVLSKIKFVPGGSGDVEFELKRMVHANFSVCL